ncbi:OSIGBa0118P15.5 protein, related [Eimeria praecox]|uniref:OSIGBa0118P15.5 protein, related n=1 Tax=Eimeria praecox TaxID=51316 RepID=U6GRP0_9EIME|nr:OSIGBa0118P15.5 protein, related [Eimeria praecox]
MTPDQLRFHKQEIAKLSAHGWIGPTYSPICAPTIMVDKRDDGTGDRQMRMVVNYQALNALTVVPDFPLPPVQTILEMLSAAKYFPTLDLEAGFHQIHMAKEDRWKTAFRSVLGLFEYKVMPFGLKGAPATFQANINAYLQPLLGHGVIAYLDDVLIYSADLPTHVVLLRKVLSIFLTNQFYPKFRKCQFARQELTYLGYTISAEGIKPAADKIEAIRVWPEVLENEMQAMTPVQQKYSVYDQELLALVTALDKWSHLLRVAKSPPSVSQANESSPDDSEPSAIPPVRPAVSATLDWPAAYAKCPVFRVPYTTAVQAAGATVQLEFRNRLLAFRFVPPFLSVCIHGLWRICVPQFPEFLTHLLYNHYDHITTGHRGQKKTFLSLSKLYYWPGMCTYTKAYVESCTQCRASKSLNQKPAGLLQQLIIPSRRWSHVSLDFITDLPLTTTGHDSILVLVGSLSKMAHFVPAKKTFTAADTVDVLADRLIRYHGLPVVLISDSGPRFQSGLWQQLRARFNIKTRFVFLVSPSKRRPNRTSESDVRTNAPHLHPIRRT